MAARKGHAKSGGRRKGTPNKATAAVKAALADAFDQLGGVAALTKWAKDEPGEFYRLWAKLLPLEVKAEVSGGVALTLVEEIIDGNPAPHDPPAPRPSPVPPE